MSTAEKPPCDEHPKLTVMGTAKQWSAPCQTCGTVYRSTDPDTPDWVRTYAAETFRAIDLIRAAGPDADTKS